MKLRKEIKNKRMGSKDIERGKRTKGGNWKNGGKKTGKKNGGKKEIKNERK